jgi:hypothetical protein
MYAAMLIIDLGEICGSQCVDGIADHNEHET